MNRGIDRMRIQTRLQGFDQIQIKFTLHSIYPVDEVEKG